MNRRVRKQVGREVGKEIKRITLLTSPEFGPSHSFPLGLSFPVSNLGGSTVTGVAAHPLPRSRFLSVSSSHRPVFSPRSTEICLLKIHFFFALEF